MPSMFTTLAGIVVAMIALIFFACGMTGIDDQLVALASRLRHRNTLVDTIFYTFSFTPIVVGALFVVPVGRLVIAGEIILALQIAAACVLALGFAFLGKFFIGRMRPLGHVTYVGRRDSAFPSAHTAGSFAAAFALAAIYPDAAPLVLVLATAVALSRLYLQMHFLSDVAGGMLLAYTTAYFALRSDLVPTFLQLLHAL